MSVSSQINRVTTKSLCCFCSMQCALEIHTQPETQEITRVKPDKEFLPTRGLACVKGIHAHVHSNHQERLKTPLIRRNGRLVETSFEEAYAVIVDRFQALQKAHGSDTIGVYGGGSLTTEKAYLLGKFARVGLQTRYIDYNGRYCMASAASAMNMAFGLDRGMTVPLQDIPLAECILLVGANVAECQPTFMTYLREARENGAKLIVIDPRLTATAKFADMHVSPKPGTDLALLNGVLHVMIREGLIDEAFIEARTLGFAEVRHAVERYTPEKTAAFTEVPIEQILQMARWYGQAKTAMLFTARGIEQQSQGVNNVLACINLVLASGKIGQPGSGFGSITGQANGQGGREHGQKADQLPGYRSIEKQEDRAYIADVWGIDEAKLPHKGVSAFEMFEKMHQGEIRGLFLLASNPATSSPNSRFVKKALERLDTLVVTDLFLTETAEFADVVLPGSAWLEDEGTITNLEGRVLLRRAAKRPPGLARLDWQILCELADRLGRGEFFPFRSAEEIFEELRIASAGGKADYAGISYRKLEGQQGVFWPCPTEDHPGVERVFTETFAHPHGKALFHAVHYETPPESPSSDYPYVVTTGRVLAHYLTGVQTRRTEVLAKLQPEPYVQMHPQTAQQHEIEEGDWVLVRTRRGDISLRAQIRDTIRPDLLFIPIHWEHDLSVNQITSHTLDPISRMPDFKYAAAAIQKLSKEEQ